MFKKDQRRFPRIDVECEINYRIVNESEFKTGIARNISSKGVLFVTNGKYEIGQLMEIKIVPGETSVPTHGAIIEIVRINPLKSDNKIEIAGLIKVMK